MRYFESIDEISGYMEEEENKQKQSMNNNSLENIRDFRFYMKYGTTAHIIFLDDLLFAVREHAITKPDRKTPHFETCIAEIEGDCPLDDSVKSFLGFASTIIHIDPVNKDGKEMPPTKKLFVPKLGAARDWHEWQKEEGSLKGRKFKVTRSNDSKSPTTGSTIMGKGEVDWEKLKQFAPEGVDPDEWLKPFDYQEIFKPKSAEELRKEVGLSAPIGSEDSQPTTNHPPKQSLADLV